MTTLLFPSPRPRIRFRAATPVVHSAETIGEDHAQREETPRVIAEPGKRRRKREPNTGSFQKGLSGNPRGRPRGAKGAKAMVRKALASRINVQTARGSRKVAIFEALLKKEVSLAAEGDWRARRTVFELGKWALGESAELPLEADAASAENLTETGRAIIDWFTDEITSRDLEEETGQ